MAELQPKTMLNRGGFVVTLGTSGSDNIYLGNVHDFMTGSFMLTNVPGSPTPSTFVLKTVPTGSGLTASSGQNIACTDTEGTSYAAGASISAAKTYRVPVGGLDLILVSTNGANGGTVYVKPVVGE
jgi:hypothetical protein